LADSPKHAAVIGLAHAIAKAEGFGGLELNGQPNLPTRCQNPGDLEEGSPTQNGKTIFSTVEAGWNALYEECELMLSGESEFYKPTETFLEIATTYTGADNAEGWATVVSSTLNLTPQARLTDWLAAC
jgi:hypothetical protein